MSENPDMGHPGFCFAEGISSHSSQKRLEWATRRKNGSTGSAALDAAHDEERKQWLLQEF